MRTFPLDNLAASVDTAAMLTDQQIADHSAATRTRDALLTRGYRLTWVYGDGVMRLDHPTTGGIFVRPNGTMVVPRETRMSAIGHS